MPIVGLAMESSNSNPGSIKDDLAIFGDSIQPTSSSVEKRSFSNSTAVPTSPLGKTALPIIKLDYLDDLEQQRKRRATFTENSKFYFSVQNYAIELEKETGDKEPSFFRENWKRKRAELAKLQEELRESRESVLKDEGLLFEMCERIASQRDSDKRLKLVVEKVQRGEIMINRIYDYNILVKELQKEKSLLKEELDRTKDQNRDLTEQLQKQHENVAKQKAECKDLQEKFGGVLMREIANKEKELNDHLQEKEKQVRSECEKKLTGELQKKEKEMEFSQAEVDALKLKNVDWVIKLAALVEESDKLQKENKKLQSSYRMLQKDFMKERDDFTQSQFEYSQLKKAYNELVISHKSLVVQSNAGKDNTFTAEELESKWKDYMSNRKKETTSKYSTVQWNPTQSADKNNRHTSVVTGADFSSEKFK